MAQAPLKRCDPEEVRLVIERIYMGEISPAEGEEICLQSSTDLESWVHQLPLNLYNNPSSSALKKKEKREKDD